MLISFSGMFPVWGADEVSLAVGTSVLFLQPLSIPISVKVMKDGKSVLVSTIERLCTLLECDVSDIMEFEPEQK